jgi:VIT1/CCC1 family predicted Fe2+/Mn2+ transporter
MTRHAERHLLQRLGWLRAAVLGANDGIVSTASLVIGVAAAGSDRADVLVAGVAGLVAGAMSMAAGEYVSVSSQADAERADLARERAELETQPELERRELAAIYESRGVEADLAQRVADQLMAHDALSAHARDELGLSEARRARPLQAAFASGAAFALGAACPLAVAALSPWSTLMPTVALGCLVLLAGMGALAARAGGAPMARGAARVALWGSIAMAATAAIGTLFDAIV